MTFNKKSYSCFLLVLLIFIFSAPLILAAVIYHTNPNYLHHNTLNKGQFLSPPLAFKNLKKHVVFISATHRPWLIFYLVNADCRRLCQKRLHLLYKIILALGKNGDQVDAALIQTGSSITLKKFMRKNSFIHVYWITAHERHRFFQKRGMGNGYYLVDPAGRIILYYSADAPGENLYKDLTRLLIHSGS
jgi:hypothetical protein